MGVSLSQRGAVEPFHAMDILAEANRLIATGVDVVVVSPANFRHYGIAYGDGIVNNLRRAPWKAALVPLFLLSFGRAARRASRDADVVHAHWLPSALPALATRKPFVLQLWGSDVALARRMRPLARWLLRQAAVVVCASNALADDARTLGARDVWVIPSGVAIPESVGDQAEYWFRFWKGSAPDPAAVKQQFAANAARVDPHIPA